MKQFNVRIQVREVGLPGLLDLAVIPVGTGREQAPESAPLLTILTAALETVPLLKHVGKAVALVSITCQQLHSYLMFMTV